MSLACRFALSLAIIGVVGATAAEARVNNHQRPVPAVREIRNAFRGKSVEARLKLLNRLQRAGEDADQPETIAALSEELHERSARKSMDAVDLKLLSLFEEYPSDDAARALESFLGDADHHVVLTALRGLLDSRRVREWGTMESLVRHPKYDQVYGLRRAVVAAAEQVASKESVDFLVATVRDADGQLKYEAARALTEITGQSFGGKGREWVQWWQTASASFSPVVLRDRPSGLRMVKLAWDDPVPEFFNVPIYARRMLFLLDRSESMASSVGGELRIDRARRELEEALLKLPVDAEFNVLAYHDFVEPFASTFVRASPDKKHEAIVFAHRLNPELMTACYDALAVGLDDHPNLEAVYFLSDGEPTSGAIIEPDAIVDAITQQNRRKLVSIYTLGIDARGNHEAFLRDLAERNYGEYFQIR